ncbi:ribokinase [Pseudomonas coleopterorum]|uniref:Ribokinase n=1 Tax=Pseudomonas coleopterorum TaxID=1605838 RepID=A0AAJ6LWV1_9PSED|nr:ribokinase [Pseudomonas coleopterorum]WNC08447.1 ribokinase [Pseudomonas coleopterorum]
MQANVLIIGSLNMDLVAQAERLPRAGETLLGQSFATVPGGKGANQAVAAARLGGQVAMIGCVGADAYGHALRQALADEGIDCQGVRVAEDVATGIAMIVVDASSQNAIVIVAGGNGQLESTDIERFDSLLQAADVVVCQLEIPYPVVAFVLQRAHEAGKTVILNPAPVTGPLPSQWLGWIDYLIPNETEVQAMTGLAVNSVAEAEQAASLLREAGAGKIIVTLGERGVLFADGVQSRHSPGRKVQAVDTTAAGDTFVGGFAAALARGLDESQAIAFGQAAAALSVTRAGAQPSIPTLAQVEQVLS